MDELWVQNAAIRPFDSDSSSAAYQVGLSFLTTHMRRAVSTCTSPEVFFGTAAGTGQTALLTGNLPSTDPLGLAMEALGI